MFIDALQYVTSSILHRWWILDPAQSWNKTVTFFS